MDLTKEPQKPLTRFDTVSQGLINSIRHNHTFPRLLRCLAIDSVGHFPNISRMNKVELDGATQAKA